MSNLITDAGEKLNALRHRFDLQDQECESLVITKTNLQSALNRSFQRCTKELKQLRRVSPTSSPSSSPRFIGHYDPRVYHQAVEAYLNAATQWHGVLKAISTLYPNEYKTLIKNNINMFNGQLDNAPLNETLVESTGQTLNEARAVVVANEVRCAQTAERVQEADRALAEHERRRPAVVRSLQAEFNQCDEASQNDDSVSMAPAPLAELPQANILIRILRAIWQFLLDCLRYLSLWFSGKTLKQEQEEQEQEHNVGLFGSCALSLNDKSTNRRSDDDDDDRPGRNYFHRNNFSVSLSSERGSEQSSTSSSSLSSSTSVYVK